MKTSTFFTVLALLFAAQNIVSAKPTTLLVEAENFQFVGNWESHKHSDRNIMALSADSSKYAPATVIKVPVDGVYHVWASVYDHAEQSPQTRTMNILVNGEELPNVLGTHGKTFFEWQYAGEVEIKAGETLLGMKTTTPKVRNARCDAIILTTDKNFNPVGKYFTQRERARYRIIPVYAECAYESDFDSLEKLSKFDGAKSVSVKNAAIKITYTQKKDAKGNVFYVRAAELLSKGRTVASADFDDELLFLTYSKTNKGYHSSYFVNWLDSLHPPKIIVGDRRYELNIHPFYPYALGENTMLRPVNVKAEGSSRLLIEYPNGVKARLSLLNDEPVAKFEVIATADRDGYYSFGFLGFNSTPRDNFNAAEIAPLLKNRRLMDAPKMIGDSMTSQPMVVIDFDVNGKPFTNALIADPEKLPFGEWAAYHTSRYGFSSASPQSAIQAAIFNPILGLRESMKRSGEPIEASWYMLSCDGDWTNAYEIANEKIFAGSELREPYTASISEAAENMAEYMKNEDASGWSPHMKARWNIESKYQVTQSSPLAEVSAAILMDDEEYYKNISLPTIEFTLSRDYVHFAVSDDNLKVSAVSSLKLTVPSESQDAGYYAGVRRLTGGGNPWLKEFYESNKGRLGGAMPAWAVNLGVHLACPEDMPLEKVKAGANEWIKGAYRSKIFEEPNYQNFVNVSFYPYWWLLNDLYEITGDKNYAKHAETGAFHTMSTLWNHPTPPKGEWEIYKDGYAQGVASIWWKGAERYRLGYDETRPKIEELFKGVKIDEKRLPSMYPFDPKKVDAMMVSRIGLGIEQPSTYGVRTQNFRNILMPSWSAEMLKAYQYGGRDILHKFSRHAIVGRFANFPGYYIRDYIDVQFDPQYPYKGPDITCLYFHHAPCQFAQTYDYLMAQAEQRTDNKIKFPFVRQQGYVWFTDRIFGLAGKVFDDASARPLIEKGAITADTHKVSVLTARGKNFVWAVLLNDAGKDIEANIAFNRNSKLLKGARLESAAVYSADGRQTGAAAIAKGAKVKIPALGLIALKIPASEYDTSFEQKPIAGAGHVSQKAIAPNWGDLHAFRIRGPFGKDSLYVVLTSKYDTQGKVKLTMNGEDKGSVSRFPYEFSIYPIPQDQDISFSVRIEEGNKTVAESETLKLGK